MKTRRFFSAFFAGLLSVLLLCPAALATDPAEPSKTPEDPAAQAKAALLVERGSDTVLYSLNADERLYPSSLVKVATALMVLEAVEAGQLSLEQELPATASALSATIGARIGLKEGELMTVRDLMGCMLVVSANDASNILAEAVAGSVPAFVEKMNARVKELGCTNTNLTNTTGEHDDNMYTSAHDLYLIAEAALSHEAFLPICDSADFIIPATNMAGERHLRTTNYLLSNWRAIGYRYTDAHGVKDSSSTQAGHCLITTATKDGLDLICVVLGAQKVTLDNGKTQVQSFSEATRLLKWGFANFAYKTILTPNDLLASMPVTMSDSDAVTLHSANEIVVLMPVRLTAEDLTRTIRFTSKSVEAPVYTGQQLAEVELSYGGTVYSVVPLVALNNVDVSQSMLMERDIREFFDRTAVKVSIAAVVGLIFLIIVWKLTIGRRRYRYGKSVRGRSNYRGRRK